MVAAKPERESTIARKKSKDEAENSQPSYANLAVNPEAIQAGSGEREDFLRDLKKVGRKLPPDHPSRSDSRKR